MSPPIDGVESLVRAQRLGGFRRAFHAIADEHGLIGRAIYQLLDDVPGTALVSGYSPELNRRDAARGAEPTDVVPVPAADPPTHLLALRGVCRGVAGERRDPRQRPLRGPRADQGRPAKPPALARDDDPRAWHELPGPLPRARHAPAPPHRRAPHGRPRSDRRRRPLPRQLRRRGGRDGGARVHADRPGRPRATADAAPRPPHPRPCRGSSVPRPPPAPDAWPVRSLGSLRRRRAGRVPRRHHLHPPERHVPGPGRRRHLSARAGAAGG